MKKLIIIACALSVVAAACAYGQDSGAGGAAVTPLAAAGKTYFLVVAGICRSDVRRNRRTAPFGDSPTR